jgi:hypothetical protein
MYCCGVTADRHRPNEMKVEDIPIPLMDNEQFREFDKLIQPTSDLIKAQQQADLGGDDWVFDDPR